VTANASGTWSATPDTSLADGEYTIAAVATDISGNTTSSGNLSGLEVDTTPIDFTVDDYRGIILPKAEGTAPPGTEIFIVGSSLIWVSLLGLDISLLDGFPSTFADADGNWDRTLSLLDLNILSSKDIYFFTLDDAGNYLVKDTDGNEYERGNIHGNNESVLEEGTTSAEVGVSQLEDDSIDLSRILGGEQTQSNEVEPLNVTLNEVISDTDDVLALDSASESSSIAFTGDTVKTAEPATDVQNQSEEMIKKLIESGNNQIDM